MSNDHIADTGWLDRHGVNPGEAEKPEEEKKTSFVAKPPKKQPFPPAVIPEEENHLHDSKPFKGPFPQSKKPSADGTQ